MEVTMIASSVKSIGVDFERRRFRKDAAQEDRFNNHTYDNEANIDQRTRYIFNRVSRTLTGRGSLTKREKETELRNLFSVVRGEIVYPLLNSPAEISTSQDRFDQWHKQRVEILKSKCPIRWDRGPELRLGIAQLIINLHCKSIWAWELVPERYSRYFHATITSVTLEHLLDRNPRGWTRWDSYDRYMRLQYDIREIAEDRNTHPMVLECWNWNTQNLS
jgi:hypothetical protein